MMLTLADGQFRLVCGKETAVLVEELSTSGDSTTLSPTDIPATGSVLHLHGVELGDYRIMLVANATTDPSLSPDHGEPSPENTGLTVESHDDEDDLLSRVVRALGPAAWTAMLAEAATAAWQQRLSDAADTALPLNSDDDDVLGPLDVAGAPTIMQLRAERRRTLALSQSHAISTSGLAIDPLQDALETAIHDLSMSVRYGASELAAATPDAVASTISAATDDSGWATRIRLLLAAEECYTIGQILSIRQYLAGLNSEDAATAAAKALHRLDQHRQRAEELIEFLTATLTRIPPPPQNLIKRVTGRRTQQNILYLVETINAFRSIAQSLETEAVSLEDIAEALSAEESADPAISSELALWSGEKTLNGPTFDEIAAFLGQLFAQQLPAARERVDLLSAQHPESKPEDLVKRVKRQAITDFGRTTSADGQDQPLLEKVARLAMEIALLRGIEPHSELAFKEMGERILSRARSALKVQNTAEEKVDAVASALGVLAKKYQPLLFEALFHAMSGARPGKAGPARDAYKFLRSTVWRTRHNPAVGKLAAGHLGTALVRAINTGTARQLIWFVDKSLPAPTS